MEIPFHEYEILAIVARMILGEIKPTPTTSQEIAQQYNEVGKIVRILWAGEYANRMAYHISLIEEKNLKS